MSKCFPALVVLLFTPALGAQTLAAETEDKPPVFRRIWPERYNQRDVVANVGELFELGVEVSDPDNADLKVTVEGLPEGATFSDEQRILRWTPTPAQRGLQSFRFIAWGGVKQAVRELHVEVTDNRPPYFRVQKRQVEAGSSVSTISFAAEDPDHDPLTYTIQGARPGSHFDPASGELTLSPSDDDVGTRSVTVAVSDGHLRVTQALSFAIVEPESRRSYRTNWASYLMPGVGYSVYAPSDRDAFGTFQGVALELLIGTWIHRNENRGPSHGRIYVNAEIFDSSDSDVANLFAYSFGFSLSFERNPQRKWLIPVYGLELGQVFHEAFDSRFHATPYFGFHVFSDPNLFVSARGGYRMVPSDMEHVGGLHAGANLNFSVW
ncbi:MAG: Ig-like domain-containing protein [Myxococcota bacterium]|nr:Ig-like domain-containing protein [Myxococcota bacterium]